ncbi:PepSY domain-containing protein [Sporosarcina sp. 179-K 3D1 HS]|uniref:PepSY domain-containing protein n=1 Tax=Sporosarcina sp. 179-K 3D1 HS TaxID=3232169 RepID=UPI0039A1A2EB
MNKWMIIPALAGTLAIGGVALANGSDTKVTATPEKMLTLQEAKDIAVRQYGGHVTEIELENRKSGYVYDVEVKSEGIEYDLDIDAKTGQVTLDDQSSSAQGSKLLTKEEAIRIAKQKAGGTVKEIELDDDDGRNVYEMELRDDQFEYEIDLDAVTGEVLKFEKDREYKAKAATNAAKTATTEHTLTVVEPKKSDDKTTVTSGQKPSMITLDQAIAIAKQKANGKVTDSELDDYVYEIEIEDGDIEYEFEIDAFTGAILSFEQD